MITSRSSNQQTGREGGLPTRERPCLPCDFPPFCRNNYYTGKLLTERDLTAEQHYFIDKLRLHHLALHGWGIICGLGVKPHPHCPDKRVILEPGMAIDGCGREIWVREEVEINLPKPVQSQPKEKEPCPPEPPWKASESIDSPKQQSSPDVQQGSSPESPPSPCPPRESFYICVRYVECETEFSPAPFDECVCNGNPQRPNRICEQYGIIAEPYWEVPSDWKRIAEIKDRCSDDCLDIYSRNAKCCPKSGWPDCIPVAVIENYEPGEIITAERIDNDTYRILLPSTRTLDEMLRCLLEKIPAKQLTRIGDIGWNHGAEYHCHDFMRFFIGDGQSYKSLEVTFSEPVRPEGMTKYTFQAMVVHHAERGKIGGQMELVPATTSYSHDHTRFRLLIDRGYAERCLRHGNFDLYITVRCDLIVDTKGQPVDGNLLARLQSDGSYRVTPPTGDGIVGGIFQSWFTVLG